MNIVKSFFMGAFAAIALTAVIRGDSWIFLMAVLFMGAMMLPGLLE